MALRIGERRRYQTKHDLMKRTTFDIRRETTHSVSIHVSTISEDPKHPYTSRIQGRVMHMDYRDFKGLLGELNKRRVPEPANGTAEPSQRAPEAT